MSKVAEIVNSKIIENLKNGVIPWVKPWDYVPAMNYVTRRKYTGINTVLLSKCGEYLT